MIPMRHEIKSLPAFFQAVWVGDKSFEIRRNDRGYKERDEIVLLEWDPDKQEFTGREINGVITYLTDYNQKRNTVVFSFRVQMQRD